MTPPQPDSWNEYQKLVLSELKRLDSNLISLSSKIDGIRQGDIAMLKADIKLLQYKSTILGALGGSVPAFVYILFKIFNV